MSSSPKRLVTAILDYIEHIEDEAYFARLLEHSSPAEIARAVVEVTASDDRTAVTHATLFAEDGRWRLNYVGFHERLIEAGILDALRANVSKENYVIRRDAVVVLGRAFCEALPNLDVIFRRCLERDPLLIDVVLREMSPDSEERRWTYVEQMIANPSYLVRWAAIEVVAWNQRYAARMNGPSIPPP